MNDWHDFPDDSMSLPVNRCPGEAQRSDAVAASDHALCGCHGDCRDPHDLDRDGPSDHVPRDEGRIRDAPRGYYHVLLGLRNHDLKQTIGLAISGF